MKEGPNISLIGSLIGEPARANMLSALISGKALTATELSNEAGVTVQTASSHLGKLESGGLISQNKQGRHRYYALANDEVAGVLEAIMGLAAREGHMRTRTGPKDPALRHARVCYNHLAGDLGVALFDAMVANGLIENAQEEPAVTSKGEKFFGDFGIDMPPLKKARRPVCKACLDWSSRRSHLAGGLGSALLDEFYAKGWAKRLENSRVVAFSKSGEKKFMDTFAIPVLNG